MGVILLCRDDVTIGAKVNTEVTFLAKFFVYLDMTFHIISPKQFIPSCFQKTNYEFLKAYLVLCPVNQPFNV
jgi:hypothetical protein